MNQWKGRVAVVTGASSGIGEAVARELVKYDIIVVGLARREEKLKDISAVLNVVGTKIFHPLRCDITKESDIVEAFKWIHQNIGPVSILVNNAGVLIPCTFLDTDAERINKVFQTNVTGPILCIKEALKSMLQNKINDGYIININSVAGNNVISVPEISPFIVYSASKHALRVISKGLRQELMKRGTKIRTCNLCPGLIKTDMIGDLDTDALLPNNKPLDPRDIANACVMVLQTHPDVEIPEITVIPVSEDH